jgi:hypothetical protein
MLLHWIESQSTPVIALIMFSGCYALAVIVHFLVARLSHSALAAEMKATTPVMLTPLAVLLGLLIAFLAQRVWNNIDHANAYIGAETSALRQTMLLSEALPASVRDPLRATIKEHVNFILEEDWELMAAAEGLTREMPEKIGNAILHVIAFVPTTPGEELVQRQIVVALEEAMQARLDRILLSEAAIAPLQWQVIVILSILILITICMVHLDRPYTTIINLFVFSTAVATCLVLIAVNDRPFASGGITLKPHAFENLARDMK